MRWSLCRTKALSWLISYEELKQIEINDWFLYVWMFNLVLVFCSMYFVILFVVVRQKLEEKIV